MNAQNTNKIKKPTYIQTYTHIHKFLHTGKNHTSMHDISPLNKL